MIVSFVSDAFDKVPFQQELTWDEFKGVIGSHTVTERDTKHDKLSCPAFCAVRFREGGRVTNKDAEAGTLAVLDVDDSTTEQEIQRIFSACEPYEYAAYTTFSHTELIPSLRFVFPLSQEVLAGDWQKFWPRMVTHLGADLSKKEGLDKSCKNIARIYFLPSCPADRQSLAEITYHPGKILDTAQILSQTHSASPQRAPAPSSEAVTDEHLEALYRLLKRRGTAHSLLCAKALKLVRNDLPFAEVGSRDDTLFKLIGELDRAYPNATPESVYKLFKTSLSHFEHEKEAWGDPEQWVTNKLLRAKETRQAQEQSKGETQDTDLRTRILEAFRGLRSEPYSEAEGKTFAQDLGIPWEQFRYHWLYQKGNSYYVRVGHDLRGPKIAAELSKVATTDLAPAITLGVDPYAVTDKGSIVPKSPAQLVESYGTRVDTVLASMVAQKSTYRRSDGTLIEAVCPLRELEPAHDPEVEQWLQLFSGDSYEKLLDWLTLCPDLSQPLPALYIKGAPGDGKSLFGESVARLWTTTQATPMEALAKSFNSMVAACPVIFADEYLPDTFRGDKGTGRLRALIAERQRMLSRKFLPDATLEGCIRLILAGNNDELIKSDEHLTDDDIKAIVDRIIYFETGPGSGDFLKALPDLGDSFRYKDRVARHIWHLCQTRDVQVRSRFGVESEAGKLHRKMTVGAGPRSVICNWLCGALLHWDQVSKGKAGHGLKVVDGKLWVNSSYIVDNWAAVNTNAKAPNTRNIGMAIAALSEAKRQKKNGIDFRVIRSELLAEWAEETGYADREQLEKALVKAGVREEKTNATN